MEWNDPVVEEVRGIREQLLEKYNGFDNFICYLKKMEKEHKDTTFSVIKHKDTKVTKITKKSSDE